MLWANTLSAGCLLLCLSAGDAAASGKQPWYKVGGAGGGGAQKFAGAHKHRPPLLPEMF